MRPIFFASCRQVAPDGATITFLDIRLQTVRPYGTGESFSELLEEPGCLWAGRERPASALSAIVAPSKTNRRAAEIFYVCGSQKALRMLHVVEKASRPTHGEIVECQSACVSTSAFVYTPADESADRLSIAECVHPAFMIKQRRDRSCYPFSPARRAL